jgi:hypothetical protein
VVGLLALVLPAVATAARPLPSPQISRDTLRTAGAQHATQVEPDTASNGSTVVAAYQVGRFADGGSAAIGVSTSFNAGRSWTSGLLPRLTNATGSQVGAERATDPAVAYDAAHRRWLIESLTLMEDSSAVVVSGSLDARTWDPPNTAIGRPYASGGDERGTQLDKSWITCDNNATSRFFGRCYVAYTDFSPPGVTIGVQSTDDGGVDWSNETFVPVSTDVPGVQPVVGANGQLALVYIDAPGRVYAVRSTDGGASFAPREVVANVQIHTRPFSPSTLRNFPIASVAVDGGGTIYVAWPDCRFRARCAANDIVVAHSTATGWSAPRPVRVPGLRVTADHALPGLGADETTSGARAHLAVTFYTVSAATCASAACRIDVRMATSVNGGATWRRPIRLNTQPMRLSWLARTISGYMVGDYVGTSFASGRAVAVYALGRRPAGGRLNESINAVARPVR